MMAMNLHDRLIGRLERAVRLVKFLHHARQHDRVWFCTEVAEHWCRTHPAQDA